MYLLPLCDVNQSAYSVVFLSQINFVLLKMRKWRRSCAHALKYQECWYRCRISNFSFHLKTVALQLRTECITFSKLQIFMKNVHLRNGSYKTINFCPSLLKIQTVVQYKNRKKVQKEKIIQNQTNFTFARFSIRNCTKNNKKWVAIILDKR